MDKGLVVVGEIWMDAQIPVRGQIGTVFVPVVSMFWCVMVFWNVERKLVPYLSKSKPLFLAFGNFEKFKKLNCNKKKWIPVLEKRAWAALPFMKWGPECCVWTTALCTTPWSADNSPVQGHVSSTPDLRAGVGRQPGWTLLFLAVRAVAGLGIDSKGNKAHVITGCSPVFKALFISWGCSIPCRLPFKTWM